MRATCRLHRRYAKNCQECTVRSAHYRRVRAKGLRDGTWEGRVSGQDLQLVRGHVLQLVTLPEVTAATVARLAGVSGHTVRQMIGGTTAWIDPHTQRVLLGVTVQACLQEASTSIWVPSVGTARRLQALAADGWDSETLSALCGLTGGSLRRLCVGNNPVVHPDTHAKVRALYEKIQSQADPAGPSQIVIRLAQRRGYLLPERWADEDIDNPDAQPLPPPPDTEDHVAITRTIEDCLHNPQPGKAADLPKAVKQELARHANRRLGWSWERIAWLMGYKSASSAHNLIEKRPDRVKEGETDGRRKQRGSK